MGFGAAPIPYSSISKYIKDTDLQDEALAFIECIRAMDEEYMRHVNSDENNSTNPTINTPVSPELFDAMFGA